MRVASAFVLSTVAVMLMMAVLPMGGAPADSGQPRESNAAVLVELFTSEGCSSCPPADRLLSDLVERQPLAGVEIIALGEHVDYWDGLGWRDRFSSPQSTGRQRDYSLHFGQDRIYTPQMIVDGAEEFVGSDKRQADQAIQRAAARTKANVRIVAASSPGPKADGAGVARWTIQVDALPPQASPKVDVYVAVTENGLSNQVAKGENRGRRLQHAAVVHVLQKIGEFDSRRQAKSGHEATKAESGAAAAFKHSVELPLDPAWERHNLRLVAFVQEQHTGRVLGAASLPFDAE